MTIIHNTPKEFTHSNYLVYKKLTRKLYTHLFQKFFSMRHSAAHITTARKQDRARENEVSRIAPEHLFSRRTGFPIIIALYLVCVHSAHIHARHAHGIQSPDATGDVRRARPCVYIRAREVKRTGRLYYTCGASHSETMPDAPDLM